ncbi:MAG: bifunctional riboflavin kinase/FAD synthetase [Saccharofermentans sp.]|nr:bifunctional riboflavin kinase/FAD synthetase [Saccharofermentans sp.]
MVYYSGTKDFSLKNTVITLGKFDGIHRGHQKLLSELKSYKEKGYTTVVLSFDFYPLDVLKGKMHPLIYTKQERLNIIEESGVDVFIEYPFTEETAHMSPEEFVKEVLIDKLDVKIIAVGEDFRFGYQRAGDVKFLKDHAGELGYAVDDLQKVCACGREISSTVIRNFIVSGELETARTLLGRPFSVSGTVVHGLNNGHALGTPTVNLTPAEYKILPPDGVYISILKVKGEYSRYPAVTNIGCNPTVAEDGRRVIETHILDYSGDLYGREIEVDLYRKLRGEIKFEGKDALREQIFKDIEHAKDYIAREELV